LVYVIDATNLTTIEKPGADRPMIITAEALSITVVRAILSDMTEPPLKASVRMNSYRISVHPDGSGNDVHIIGSDGARQTVLGFETEAAAQTWIVADQARDDLRLTLK
jgi:hypothetical protein